MRITRNVIFIGSMVLVLIVCTALLALAVLNGPGPAGRHTEDNDIVLPWEAIGGNNSSLGAVIDSGDGGDNGSALTGDLSTVRFSYPRAVAASRDGTVCVASTGNNLILVKDPDGTRTILGSQGTGPGQFNNPVGVAAGPDGTIYVADYMNHRIQIRSPDGTWTAYGNEGSGSGQLKMPFGLTLADREGSVIVCVADTGNDRIQTLIPGWGWNPSIWATTGSRGTAPGQFFFPCGLAVDTDYNLYVADTGNNRIQVNNRGNWTVLGSEGTGPGQFDHPGGVAVGPDGTVYVADTMNNRIQAMSPDGTWTIWGSHGWGLGQFYRPCGVAVGPDGTVYVADTYNSRVQARSPDGKWTLFY